jgi:phage FluMu gp28-like protein
MLSSHNGDLNPFNDLIKKFRAKESALHKVYRIEFKEAIEQGLYKRICQVKGEEWNKDKQQEWIEQIYEFYGDDASEELDVIPKSGSGVFLTRSQIEAVMENSIPVVRLEEKNDFSEQSLISRKQKIEAWCEDYLNSIILNFRRDRATYLGMDFARSNDLTVLWFIQETNDLRLETILVVELRNIPHANQSQILNYIVHRLPKFSAGALDGTGIGNAVAESARDEFGKSIESIIFGAQTNTFYRELMPKFLAYFQDRNITIPKDKEIMEDLRLIRLEKGIARIPNERTKDKLGNQRHGDAAMALILAVHAVKNISTLSYDWMPAKQEFNYKNERRENFMKQSFDDDYAFMIDDRGRL